MDHSWRSRTHTEWESEILMTHLPRVNKLIRKSCHRCCHHRCYCLSAISAVYKWILTLSLYLPSSTSTSTFFSFYSTLLAQSWWFLSFYLQSFQMQTQSNSIHIHNNISIFKLYFPRYDFVCCFIFVNQNSLYIHLIARSTQIHNRTATEFLLKMERTLFYWMTIT